MHGYSVVCTNQTNQAGMDPPGWQQWSLARPVTKLMPGPAPGTCMPRVWAALLLLHLRLRQWLQLLRLLVMLLALITPLPLSPPPCPPHSGPQGRLLPPG
jgi:hypothetical protein